MNYNPEDDSLFSADYYQHLLALLTLNLRALITELTTLADKFVDHAPEIVALIEERIRKCLPQYKLYSFYLLDSICKNIGNPYNVIFGLKLYQIFTQTYLVVTDTPTRQNLINLFKTWTKAKSSLGLDLFPAATIDKMEQFIIKATSINGPNGGPPPVMGAEVPRNVNISLDLLLREGNYLLQYIIALDEGLEKAEPILQKLDLQSQQQVRLHRLLRHNLVMAINTISEAVLSDPKLEAVNFPSYQAQLQDIRKQIDGQSFQQQTFMKTVVEPAMARERDQKDDLDRLQNIQLNEKNRPVPVQVEINLKAEPRLDLETILDGVMEGALSSVIRAWGKPIHEISTPPVELESPITEKFTAGVPEQQDNQPDSESLASSLGFNFSMNFQGSFLGSPKNEVVSEVKDDNDMDDSYDPEHSVVVSPRRPVAAGKSSLKRGNETEERPVKRVRFDV